MTLTEVCSLATVSAHQVCFAILNAASFQQLFHLLCQEASVLGKAEAGTKGWPQAALSNTYRPLLTQRFRPPTHPPSQPEGDRAEPGGERKADLYGPLMLRPISSSDGLWNCHMFYLLQMKQAHQSWWATRCIVCFIKIRLVEQPLWTFNGGFLVDFFFTPKSSSLGQNRNAMLHLMNTLAVVSLSGSFIWKCLGNHDVGENCHFWFKIWIYAV